MLDKRTLDRINDRPQGRGPASYAALGAVAVALVSALFSYMLAAAVLLAGAAAVFLLYKRGVAARTARLTYNLEGEAASKFAAVQEACKALAGAKKVWRVEGDAEGLKVILSDGEALSFGKRAFRHPIEAGLFETPGLSANVEVWGIKTGTASLFFLPEGILSCKEDHYRAVSYDSFGVVYRPLRVTEDGEPPEVAEVVGETWRHVREDGGPDLRYPENPRYAIVSYGLLSVTGAGHDVRLLVSDKAAAVGFARTLGAGRGEEPRGSASSARAEKTRRNAEAEIEKRSSLLKVLGVEPGASQKEIDAAYKKKAKTYHPDRVAALAPEVREMAELRMKEINAAYGELKRRVR